MWAYESVFYQIYPLGFCGAPKQNDGILTPRLQIVTSWIPHILDCGANAIYFSPLFESDAHGYDTRDYRKLDCRLGTNEDFAAVCRELHQNGIKVVLDGVFNHVVRGFWAFQDVLSIAKIHLTKIGFISILAAMMAITMACGTKVGKATMNW